MTQKKKKRMRLSNDFLLRVMGAQEGGSLLVHDRSEMDDVNALKVFKRVGSQQTYIDASRCCNLSSQLLNRHLPMNCPVLLYLDLSYTKCDDLTYVFQYCQSLKTLNIAGLDFLVHNLKGIGGLYNLEVLSLRSSSTVDIRELTLLPVLRSVDLGYTKLQHIEKAFENKNRLEEIVMDYCELKDVQIFLDMIPGLEALKAMNIQGSNLMDSEIFINDLAVGPIYFEKTCRRQVLFNAVINNQALEVYRLITSGMDINIRATHEDDIFFAQAWYKRCYYAKTRLSAPFFLVNGLLPSDSQYHPTPLHIALLFNSLACVKLLLDMNCNREALVFLTNVSLDHRRKKLFENTKDAAVILEEELRGGGNSSPTINRGNDVSQLKILTPYQMIHYLYQRNVHRLTENLIGKKIAKWKPLLNQYRKQYLILWDNLATKNKNTTMKELEEITAFTKVKGVNDHEESGGGVEQEQEEEEEEGGGGEKEAREGEGTTAGDTTTDKSNNNNDNGMVENELFTLEITSKPPTPAITSQKSSKMMRYGSSSGISGKNTNNQETNNNNNNDKVTTVLTGGSISQKLVAPKRIVRQKDSILPPKEEQFEWRDHGLVHKILGAPIVVGLNNETNGNNSGTANAESGNNWMNMSESKDWNSNNRMSSNTSDTVSNSGTKVPKVAKRRQSSLQLAIAKSHDEVQSTDSIIKEHRASRMLSRSSSFRLPKFTIAAGGGEGINEDDGGVMNKQLEISYLGKKEFWMESRTHTILDNVAKMEEEYDAIQAQEAMLPMTREMLKKPTLMARKKMFLEGLQERFDAKLAAKDHRHHNKPRKQN